MLALPRAQINSIACCGNNDRQPDDPTCHSSPPRKWQRTMAPKKETTPTAAPHGLSPNTLTAILATVQLKRKSASFDIVCLFIPHLSFQDSHFPACVEGLSFRFTPLLSHSVAARPDFWGQPRRATVLASDCSVGKDRMKNYSALVKLQCQIFFKKIGDPKSPIRKLEGITPFIRGLLVPREGKVLELDSFLEPSTWHKNLPT